jgi:hypothetical protein
MPSYNWLGYPQYPNSVAWGTGRVVSNPTEQETWGLPDGGLSRIVNPNLQGPVTGPRLVAAGPITQAVGGVISPTFGAPTTVGNLLVCLLIGSSNNSIATNPNSAWALTASRQSPTICSMYSRFNCLAGESPPTFTDGSGGSNFGSGILLEFAGVLTTSPIDQQGSVANTTNPFTFTMGGVDSAAGDLLVAVSGNANTTPPTGATMSFSNASANVIGSLVSHQVSGVFAWGVTTTNASANAATTTWTGGSGTNQFNCTMASFKAAGPPLVTGAITLAATAGLTTANESVTEVASVTLAGTAGLTVAATTAPGGVQKFDTLVDTFTGSSLNASVWNFSGTNVAVVANQLQISSSLSAATYQCFTQNFYDLTNSQLAIQLANGGTQTINSWQDFPILLQDSGGTNQLYWYTLQGAIAAYKVVAGTSTQVFFATYSSTTHQWLRIREASGTTYWEYSADGITWVTAHSEADPITETSLRLIIQAGQYNVETSTTAALYDNVNNLPVAVTMAGTAGMTVGAVVTEVAAVPMAATTSLTVTPVQKFNTLVDDFSSGSLSPTLWNHSASNTAVVSQQLQISSSLTATEYQVFSQNYYDLTNSQVVIQLVNAGNESINSWQNNPILLMDPTGTNQLYWYVLQGTIAAYKMVANTTTQVFAAAYSSTTHQWLRIREASGTTYWDYSADGANWTTAHSEADPIAEYFLRLIIQAGQYNVEASTTTATYDNVNNPPVFVTLAGSAGLTVAAAVTEIAGAALTATAALTVAATVTEQAAVPLAASAGMTVAASVTQLASVVLAGGAALNVSALVTEVAAVTETATAGMTVGALVTEVASVALAGTAGMTVAATRTQFATVPLAGTAGMTVAASVTELTAVSLAGTAGMTVVASVTEVASVALSGTAGMTVAASVTEVASVPLAATAGMTVAGTWVQQASVPLAASTTLTMTALVTEVAAVALAGSASLTVAGIRTQLASVALSGTAGLTITPLATEVASVVLSGSTILTVSAGGTQAGIVVLGPAVAGLTVTGLVTEVASAALAATAGMTVGATVQQVAGVTLAGAAQLTITPLVTELASVALAVSTTLTVAAGGTQAASVALAGSTGMTVLGLVTQVATVALAATAGMTVTSVVTVIAGGAAQPASLRATSTGSTGAAAATSFTVAQPAGLATGDTCLLYVATNALARTATATGFTAVTPTSGNSQSLNLLYRTITGAESWPLTVTVSGAAAESVGVIYAAQGAVGFDPLPASSGQTNASSTTITTAGITTTLNNDLVVWFGNCSSASGGAPNLITAPAGTTARSAQINTSNGSTTNLGALVADTVQATAGANTLNGTIASPSRVTGGVAVALQGTPAAGISFGASAGLTVSAGGIQSAAVSQSATAGLNVSPLVTELAAVSMAASTTWTGISLPSTVQGQVSMAPVSSLVVAGQVLGNDAVVMVATAALTSQSLPQVVTGQVSMASQAALSISAKPIEVATFLATAVASLMVFVVPRIAGSTVFTATSGMIVVADTSPGVRVHMSATASMMVTAEVHHISPVFPTLAEQIAAVAGEDPILLGATGYGDDVFTSRLVGDTN